MVDEAQLSTMHAANEETKQEVQTKINRAVALGCACEGYIDLVSLGSKPECARGDADRLC